jgi:hypothetical protein
MQKSLIRTGGFDLDTFVIGSEHNVLTRTTRALASMALTAMAHRYGINGISPRDYHNPEHVYSTMLATYQILQAQQATEKQLAKGVIAASLHDIDLLAGPRLNEQRSGQFAAELMCKSYVFTVEDCDEVAAAIEDTYADVSPNGIVQYPRSALGAALCDGDLSSLGDEWSVYWDAACRIRTEMCAPTVSKAIKDGGFLALQIGVLDHYRPHTEEASVLFPNREENLAAVRRFASVL